MSNDLLVNQIDELLPQTQCTLCGYNGCRPYAAAVAQGESIDRCLPGGTPTLIALAQLVKQDPTPYLASMAQKTKSPTVAVIRENECIGCTKCIQACPVDAIIGASKFMHTVISDACTGCELCVAPCPVDCISLLPVNEPSLTEKTTNATRWRERYQQHQVRVHRDNATQANPAPLATVTERKQSILDAVARVKAKKNQ